MSRDELIAHIREMGFDDGDHDVEGIAEFILPLLAAERGRAIEECAQHLAYTYGVYPGSVGERIRDEIRALRAPSKEQPGTTPTSEVAPRAQAATPESRSASPALRQRAEELLAQLFDRPIDAMLAFGEEREAAGRDAVHSETVDSPRVKRLIVDALDEGARDAYAQAAKRAREMSRNTEEWRLEALADELDALAAPSAQQEKPKACARVEGTVHDPEQPAHVPTPPALSDADVLDRAAEILVRRKMEGTAATLEEQAKRLRARARAAPPEPDWADEIAREAALLRERFGPLVQLVNEASQGCVIDRAEARREYDRLRGEKEKT